MGPKIINKIAEVCLEVVDPCSARINRWEWEDKAKWLRMLIQILSLVEIKPHKHLEVKCLSAVDNPLGVEIKPLQ